MTEDEYLKDRLENQIDWYSHKANTNKNWYYVLKVTEISMAVTIPFLTGQIDTCGLIKYVIGGMGLIVAALSGIMAVLKFHEKWIDYRMTGETLKHEKFMYKTQSGPYKDNATLQSLVERVEMHISKENSSWNQLMLVNKDKKESEKK